MVLVLWLALPLLVTRIFTNHAEDIFALDDAAALAKAFDGCSYFHVSVVGFLENGRWI